MTTVIRETVMRRLHPWLRQWASPLAIMLGLLGLLVLVVVAILYMVGLRAYRVVSDLVLWATGLVILAYTLETWALHQQLVRQYELDVRPLLIVTGPDNTGDYLQVRNIGRSPALAIHLDPLVVPLGPGGPPPPDVRGAELPGTPHGRHHHTYRGGGPGWGTRRARPGLGRADTRPRAPAVPCRGSRDLRAASPLSRCHGAVV
jgi:hypothetical protein